MVGDPCPLKVGVEFIREVSVLASVLRLRGDNMAPKFSIDPSLMNARLDSEGTVGLVDARRWAGSVLFDNRVSVTPKAVTFTMRDWSNSRS